MAGNPLHGDKMIQKKDEQKASVGIKNLPPSERPREKLFRNGAESLSNAEILALLLGSGTRRQSALALAEHILSVDPSGLRFLRECSPEELCRIDGVGPARAAVLLAASELGRRLGTMPGEKRVDVSDSYDVAALFMEDMRYLKKETFRVLLLNAKNEIIMIDEVSIGSLVMTDANPREVFFNPLRRGAASVILVHNHPSGNPEPSQSDLILTEKLSAAGDLLGIEVLDHIIIGDGRFFSMKGAGLFEGSRH